MRSAARARDAALLVLLTTSGTGLAQRASENAVASADDGFGSAVGLETTGIYTDADTRGFSPLKAGNGRIEGIYFDPVNPISSRLKVSTAIRVGFAALEYPFQAPTGIADYKFRPFPTKRGISLSHTFNPFGGIFTELDVRLPVIKDRLSLTGGYTLSRMEYTDATDNFSTGWTVRPILRLGNGGEISPYIQQTRFHRFSAHPLVIVNDFVPAFPRKRRLLGQKWADARYDNNHYGLLVKTPITERLSLRGGLFHLVGSRDENYSELFSLIDRSELAIHRLIADPPHEIRTTSGELQAAFRLGEGRWQHRIIAGYRARNRLNENGGSDLRNLGLVTYGQPDPEPEPVFDFGRPNSGRVKQSALLLGYLARIEGIGSLNLGLQKARYRARARDGRTGAVTFSRDDPWLYNAALGIELPGPFSLYLATQRGLEDSGTAPENAANRNEQLPATRSTQYEGGVRWSFAGGQLAVNAFQISKPYFAFDATNVFTQLGTVRHRGIETSLAGQFGKRLNIVAGAVALQARASGPARDLGLVGARPAGVPSLYARIDANYRTDLFGGLTPTLALTYTGKRAVGARPLASLGGRQLSLPGALIVDLGVRQQFRIGRIPASFRAVVNNVFDKETWKVAAPNTMFIEERRRFQLVLTTDL